jgi:hypothetical protein
MRGSDREAGPKAAEEKTLKGPNTQEGKVRRSLFSDSGFRSPSRSELTSGVAPAPAKVEAEKRQERRGPEKGTAGREEQGPEGRTPWALPWSTDQVPGPEESKPSRGYSNPEGGRCRGVEPPGNRIHRVGTCHRGRNSRRAVFLFRSPSGRGKGRGTLRPCTSRTSQARDSARPCVSARGSNRPLGRPPGGRTSQGMPLNQIGGLPEAGAG